MMGSYLLSTIPPLVEEFARGGGGGSGGGGGGSSGVGGSGSGYFIVGLAGYIPMHFLGSQLRRKMYKDNWMAGQTIGWVIAGLVAITCLVLVFTLHSFLLDFYVVIPIGVGALIGMATGLSGALQKVSQNTKIKKALNLAASNDAVWNEATILSYVEGIFYKFQQDWSTFDVASMQTYMSVNYYNHTTLMMAALKGAHRINRVLSPSVASKVIIAANDADDNTQDTFVVAITASADDQLFDDRTNTLLFKDKNSFTEYWRFVRRDNSWLFDGIRQETESAATTNSAIEQFARQQGLYYSADWGWLLLPADGYVFTSGKFGTSDINNHTIGMVNNVLTQLYTYTPNPNAQSIGGIDQYLIVQTNVPKTYGRILVRRRSKFINWPVKGLTQVKMEWGEFNTIYDVYASNLERVTSFELLNPAFMAQLRDLSFEVNIEVVDNVVYLFTKGNTNAATYGALYDIVLKAHKEMQL